MTRASHPLQREVGLRSIPEKYTVHTRQVLHGWMRCIRPRAALLKTVVSDSRLEVHRFLDGHGEKVDLSQLHADNGFFRL